MSIYLGNLTPEQIESRLGIELTAEDKELLRKTHQPEVNNVPIASGKWHCFDLPFMIMTSDVKTARMFVDIFSKYEPSTFRECLQIGFGNGGANE